MRTLAGFSLLTLVLMVAPASATAQASIEITVQVPVNLTQLSPEIEKVKVECVIHNDAIPGSATARNEDFPVSGSRVVTMATLVFSLKNLDLSLGRNAQVTCYIRGYTTATGWRAFDVTVGTSPFRTNPVLNNQSSAFVLGTSAP